MTTHEQVLASLAYANEVRKSRAKVLNDLNAGKRSLRAVLEHPDVQTALIFNVLRRQRRWGRARTTRLLERLMISETRQVQFLTQRQKDVIIELARGDE